MVETEVNDNCMCGHVFGDHYIPKRDERLWSCSIPDCECTDYEPEI